MTIRYNAPVTLTFALISTIVLVLDQLLGTGLIPAFFMIPGKSGFDSSHFPHYLALLTHIAGHGSWGHLMANFALILLLGPILEEKYGSSSILIMMMITAVITGLLNVLVFNTALFGASGIAFMMILLISFTNIRNGEIPLTFILVLFLYLAKEIITIFESNQISEFAHIIGGFFGSIFGYLRPRKR